MFGGFLQSINSAGLFKNWSRENDGTTAIEFSLLAIPFVFLLTGVIELSLMFASATMLEGATSSAARLIRTGQIQQSTEDVTVQEAMFRDAVCNFAVVLVNCNDVMIQVSNINNFSNFGNFGATLNDDGDMDNQGFDVGGVSDVILVRVGYRYNLMTPFIGTLLGENGTSSRLFMSTIVQQTEPYEITGEEDG